MGGEVTPFIDADGREWRLFEVEFRSDGRRYTFDLWALSEYHANLRLADLRETARVTGEVLARGEF